MARLIVESGAEAGMVYPLKDDATTLGRSASCTVQVVDKRVSRHHCALRRSHGSFVAEDLGSKNGTLLNGQPLVGRVKLKSGDRLTVGDSHFVFEREPGEAAASGDSTRSGHVKLVPGDLPESRQEIKVDSKMRRSMPTASVAPSVLQDPNERIKVLYEVAESISSILDLDELLERIMDSLWRVLNPFRGVVFLLDEHDKSLEPVLVRNRDESEQDFSISSGVVNRCMDERIAVLVSDAMSDVRFSANESIIGGRIRSAMCSPLIYNDEVLGAIYIDTQEPGNMFFTNDELELLTGIAQQSALGIASVRMHERMIRQQRTEKELEIARTIQMNLLPKTIPEIENLQVSAMSLPARQVGGDYYDFVSMDDGRLAIVAADVSGKGVPAAILTAVIRASVRVEAERTSGTVSDLVETVNRWTYRDAANNMFVTMVLAFYDPVTRTLEYTNAGHSFPLLFSADGSYRTLERGGCFLGISDSVVFESEVIAMQPGDTLVLYTDGVTDTQNDADEIFGTDRLIEIVRKYLAEDPEELRDEIYEATIEFRGPREQFDDLTIIVARF